jgi:Zn-dependent protease with chaperone function
MTIAVAGVVVAAIGVPHLLRLDRASPALGATIWLSALLLRALTALFTLLFLVLYLPATELFSLVTHWCWHAVIPVVATHLPLNGHAFGDLAVMLPAFVLAASMLSVVVGLWRAARRVRRLLARAVLGPGPGRSLVLADGDVLVAAAGLRKPRVVVSAGALLAFDDEELAASLEHEHGHIARRHRYLLVAAELCRALARFLPGTRRAARELVFQLERDADRYAIARRHDPIALASAICKAATAEETRPVALALGGGVATRRVQLLLDDDAPQRRRRELPLRVLACAMVSVTLVGAAALPAAAHTGYHVASATPLVEHCVA